MPGPPPLFSERFSSMPTPGAVRTTEEPTEPWVGFGLLLRTLGRLGGLIRFRDEVRGELRLRVAVDAVRPVVVVDEVGTGKALVHVGLTVGAFDVSLLHFQSHVTKSDPSPEPEHPGIH